MSKFMRWFGFVPVADLVEVMASAVDARESADRLASVVAAQQAEIARMEERFVETVEAANRGLALLNRRVAEVLS